MGSLLTEEEQALVKQVDDDLLFFDLRETLGIKDLGEEPKLRIEHDYTLRPFEAVEQEYLAIYEQWKLF